MAGQAARRDLQDVAGQDGTPEQQLELESVLGISSPCPGTVSLCPAPAPQQQLAAFAAGPCVVVHDTDTRRQLRILRSRTSNRAIAVVAWSPDGSYVLAGEAAASGGSAAVHVWDVGSGECVQQLRGQHKQGVGSLSFSPDGKLLATTGAAYDGHVYLWNWRSGQLLARQSLQAEAAAAVFTEDGSNLIGVGKGAYKVWAVSEGPAAGSRARGAGGVAGGGVVLSSKPVTLKDHRGAAFVGVCTAPAPAGQPPGSCGVYALTAAGTLVLMRATARMPDKAVDLQVRAAFGLSAAPGQVAVACSNGIVRIFAAKSLEFRGTLPRLLPRGGAAAASFARGGWRASGSGAASGSADGSGVDPGALREAAFPDALGCTFSACGQRLAVAYRDRAVIFWDVTRPAAAERLFTMSAHCEGIWDAAVLPAPAAAPGGAPQDGARAVTCSSDGSIRVWNLQPGGRTLAGIITASAEESPADAPRSADPERRLAAQLGACASGAPPLLRCLRVSADGRHLAVGDEEGNLRIYDLLSLKLLRLLEAHNGVLLALDFSPAQAGSVESDGDACGLLLASGGRDGLIHLYDARVDYDLVDTLDDHRAPVTGVRFAAGGKSLVSCSADGTIVFRVLAGGRDGGCAVYHSEKLPRGCPLYDLALDPLESKVAAVGQDGAVRFWDVASGQPAGLLAPERGAAETVRISIDPGGVVAVSSHADGSVRLHHLPSGRVVWKAWGHGDVVTAAAVSSDLERMVSVSGDGCVFVWRLPPRLSAEIKAAAARVAAARAPAAPPARVSGAVTSPPRWLAAAAGAGASPQASAASPAQRRLLPALEPAGSSPELHGPSSAHRGDRPSPLRTSTDFHSEGTSVGVSQTILRVQAGRPLVPSDRLPAWAARNMSPSPKKRPRAPEAQPPPGDDEAESVPPQAAPAAAAAAAAGDDPASGAVAAAAAAAGPPGIGGKWALSFKRGASVFDEQRGVAVEVSGHRRLSAESSPQPGAAARPSASPSVSCEQAWYSPATDADAAPACSPASGGASAAGARVAAVAAAAAARGAAPAARREDAEEQLVFEEDADTTGGLPLPAFNVSVVHGEADGEVEADGGEDGEPAAAGALGAGEEAGAHPGGEGGDEGLPEEWSDALGGAPAGPAGPDPTPGRVPDTIVRDLFKRHFDALNLAPTPAPVDERRMSLSAKFLQEQGLLQPVAAAAGGAAPAPACGCAGRSQGPGAAAAAAGAAAAGAAAAARRSPAKHAPPRARQWREGKMNQELAGMRARLANLQQAFAAQQQEALLTRSPAKPSPRPRARRAEQQQAGAEAGGQEVEQAQASGVRQSPLQQQSLLQQSQEQELEARQPEQQQPRQPGPLPQQVSPAEAAAAKDVLWGASPADAPAGLSPPRQRRRQEAPEERPRGSSVPAEPASACASGGAQASVTPPTGLDTQEPLSAAAPTNRPTTTQRRQQAQRPLGARPPWATPDSRPAMASAARPRLSAGRASAAAPSASASVAARRSEAGAAGTRPAAAPAARSAAARRASASAGGAAPEAQPLVEPVQASADRDGSAPPAPALAATPQASQAAQQAGSATAPAASGTPPAAVLASESHEQQESGGGRDLHGRGQGQKRTPQALLGGQDPGSRGAGSSSGTPLRPPQGDNPAAAASPSPAPRTAQAAAPPPQAAAQLPSPPAEAAAAVAVPGPTPPPESPAQPIAAASPASMASQLRGLLAASPQAGPSPEVAASTLAAQRASAAPASAAPPSPQASELKSPGSGGKSLRKGLMALLGIDDTPPPAKRAPATPAATTPAPAPAPGSAAAVASPLDLTPPQFTFAAARGGASMLCGGGPGATKPPHSTPRVWPGWGAVEGTPPAATPVAGLIPFSFQGARAEGGAASAAAAAPAERSNNATGPRGAAAPGAVPAADPDGAFGSPAAAEPRSAGGAGSGYTAGAEPAVRHWDNPVFNLSPCGSTAPTPLPSATGQQAGSGACSPDVRNQPSPAAAGRGGQPASPSPACAAAGGTPAQRPQAPGSAAAQGTPSPARAPTVAAAGDVPGPARASVEEQQLVGGASASGGSKASSSRGKKPKPRDSTGVGDASPAAGMLGLLQRMRLFAGGAAGAAAGSGKHSSPKKKSERPDAAPAPPAVAAAGAADAGSSTRLERPAASAAPACVRGGPALESSASARGFAVSEEDVSLDLASDQSEAELERAAQQLRAATDAVQRLLVHAEASKAVVGAAGATAAAAPSGSTAGGGAGSHAPAHTVDEARKHLLDQVMCSMKALQALAIGDTQAVGDGGSGGGGGSSGGGGWGIPAAREGPSALEDLSKMCARVDDMLAKRKLSGSVAAAAGESAKDGSPGRAGAARPGGRR